MADVSQVITLGIGTPADIEHFVLFGLATEQAAKNPQATTLGARSLSTTVISRAIANTVKARSGALTVKVRNS